MGTATMAETLRALADVPARDTRQALERAAEEARLIDERLYALDGLGHHVLVERARRQGLPIAADTEALRRTIAQHEVRNELTPRWIDEDIAGGAF